MAVIGAVERVPEPVATATYFVVAEALTNAAKHAQARSVKVSIDGTARSRRRSSGRQRNVSPEMSPTGQF